MNMIKHVPIFIVSTTVVFTSGCGASLREKVTVRSMEIVKERASFDMECNEVSTQLLGDVVRVPNPEERYLTEINIGAIGCGKKASYLTRCTSGLIGNARCTINFKE